MERGMGYYPKHGEPAVLGSCSEEAQIPGDPGKTGANVSTDDGHPWVEDLRIESAS